MSRIGRVPIPIPKGVTVASEARSVTVTGPKGSLTLELRPEIDLAVEGGEINLTPNGKGNPREARAFHGMTRALVNNMVAGVTAGYGKTLEIVGVGWNASIKGKDLVLNIGFCLPKSFALPAGVQCETPNPTTIVIKGTDKRAVGQFAADVRAIRPPEPYKGKGIRYQGEYVRRKAGKSFGS
jgi:large subunit ribosomal protein L6